MNCLRNITESVRLTSDSCGSKIFRNLKVKGEACGGQSQNFFRQISFQKGQTDAKPWREAASLLIVAPMNQSQNSSLGYLMIERSKLSSVMPGGTVFPGGVVSPAADESHRWIHLYNSVNIDLRNLHFLSKNAHIPDIYKTQPEGVLPKEVVLRLTAIRETFEEVGILFCKPLPHLQNQSDKNPYEYSEFLEKKDVVLWQKKIRKNPEEFINLCSELQCLPDISGIHEWSNWLTPSIFKSKSRFDTMFYMIILPKMLRVVFDNYEATGAQWSQPSTLLEEHSKGEVKLMPPQIYELGRLQNLKTISDLEDRIKSRMELGIERYFPVIKAATDGQVFLLPGDDLYPKTPDLLTLTKPNTHKLSSSLQELKDACSAFHRTAFKNGSYETSINVTRYGHIY